MIEESEKHRQICTRRLISILQSCSLRRTKELLHLPDITDTARKIELSEHEWKQYNASKESMNRRLRTTVDETSVLSRFGMFQIQLQLRILCNHGTWQHQFHWARGNRLDEQEDALASIEYAGETRCSACRQLVPLIDTNSVYNRSASNCKHVICSDCFEGHESGIENGSTKQCPQCIASGIFVQKKHGEDSGFETYFQPQGYSSKMEALISDLSRDIGTTKR
jgi:SWI/SNF-related matrix-associated actin-dependent regulator of chromatin subfamily A3